MVYREWKLYCWELEFFHSVRCQPRLTEGGLHAESSKIAQVLVCRLLPANILNHSPKSCRREGLFSFSWIFVSGGRSSASGSDLGRSSRGRAPTKYDSVYPTFHAAGQARNGLGRELRRDHSAAFPRLRTRFDHRPRPPPQAGAR